MKQNLTIKLIPALFLLNLIFLCSCKNGYYIEQTYKFDSNKNLTLQTPSNNLIKLKGDSIKVLSGRFFINPLSSTLKDSLFGSVYAENSYRIMRTENVFALNEYLVFDSKKNIECVPFPPYVVNIETENIMRSCESVVKKGKWTIFELRKFDGNPPKIPISTNSFKTKYLFKGKNRIPDYILFEINDSLINVKKIKRVKKSKNIILDTTGIYQSPYFPESVDHNYSFTLDKKEQHFLMNNLNSITIKSTYENKH